MRASRASSGTTGGRRARVANAPGRSMSRPFLVRAATSSTRMAASASCRCAAEARCPRHCDLPRELIVLRDPATGAVWRRHEQRQPHSPPPAAHVTARSLSALRQARRARRRARAGPLVWACARTTHETHDPHVPSGATCLLRSACASTSTDATGLRRWSTSHRLCADERRHREGR